MATSTAQQGYLDPFFQSQFNTGISNANLQYAQQLAQNEYARGQTSAQFGNQRNQLLRQYHLMRSQMPYAANARGILGSGIWHQSLQDAATNQQQLLGQLALQRSGALGGLDLLRQQLEQTRDTTLANLRAQYAAARQSAALNF